MRNDLPKGELLDEFAIPCAPSLHIFVCLLFLRFVVLRAPVRLLQVTVGSILSVFVVGYCVVSNERLVLIVLHRRISYLLKWLPFFFTHLASDS